MIATREKISDLIEKNRKLLDRAKEEGRGLTHSEQIEFDNRLEEIDKLRKMVEAEEKHAKLEDWAGRSIKEPPKIDPETQEYFSNATFDPLVKDRRYRSIFKRTYLSDGGFQSFDEFARVIKTGRYDPRLENLRSINEGVPSEGGFLVPSQFAAEIFDASLEGEIVRPLARLYPMDSNELNVPATVIGDHSQGLYGNLIGYWKGEAQTLTESEPKFRSVKLETNKLTIYGKSSSEWLQDAPKSGEILQQLFINGLGWYLDRAFLKGTGAGQPLGILNSNALITVSKEAGQSANTIVYENLVNMLSRLHPGCYKNALWIAHPTTIPQLLSLYVPTGSGGEYVPVLQDRGGNFTLLTKPVIFTEKLEPLGTKGDIMLCDFTQYAIGLRGDLRFESSIHVHFQTDEIAHRIIARVDGMPLWDSALTLEDGSTTVGPFVALEDRA